MALYLMSRPSPFANLRLTQDERTQLSSMLQRQRLTLRDFRCITSILLTDSGLEPRPIAEILDVLPDTVRRWRRAFARGRIAGLFKPRKPRPPRKYSSTHQDRILALVAQPPPPGCRWWTAKLIAERISGISYDFIWNVIKKHGICLRAGRRRYDRR